MVMRMGGLASGMDIDALVEKLMKAERMPLDKTFQKKQTYEWQRDSYRSVNAQTQKLNKYLEDNMFLQSQILKKTATSTNDNLVQAKATGSATGSLNIESVTQLATSSQKIGEQTAYSASTKLADMGISSNSIQLQAIDQNGRLAEKATTISFDPSKDTVQDLMKKINDSNAGVTAIFENGQMSITANHTGKEKSGQGEIVFAGGQEVFDKLGFSSTASVTEIEGKNAIFKVNGISTERSSNSFTMSGYELNLKETFNAKQGATERVNVAQKERDNAAAAISGLENAKTSATTNYNDYKATYEQAHQDLFGENTLTAEQQLKFDKLSNVSNVAKLNTSDLVDLQNTSIDFTDKATIKASIESSTLTEEQKSILYKLNAEDLQTLQSSDGADVLNRAKQVDLEKNYQSMDKKFLSELTTEDIDFLTSIKGKTNDEMTNSINDLPDGDVKDKFKSMNKADLTKLADLSDNLLGFKDFQTVEKQHTDNKAALDTATVKLDQGNKRLVDAEQSLLNAKDAETATAGSTAPTVSAVTMTSTTDTKEIKDKIKDFVKNYNEMLDSLNGLLKEKKHRDFPPLTKEQREDMSESEQKLWDEKAKSGLLRNDSLIREGLAKMRMQFSSPVGNLGDKTIDSLAEIGITTSPRMTENGKLVIDEEKLDKALAKDPEQVVKMFTQRGSVDAKTGEDTRGITERLRDEIKNLTRNIEKKAGKEGATDQSYGIGKKIVESDDRITKLQAKMKDIEARYWKQFTAMEKAINKANEQSGMFAQFGQ